MSATKKQVTDLENAVVILEERIEKIEERIEKIEEENQLLKQMITMQSTVIDNLQTMMKMLTVSATPCNIVQVAGGNVQTDDQEKTITNNDTRKEMASIKSLKTRMSRVA